MAAGDLRLLITEVDPSARLLTYFQQLDKALSSDMVGKFVPVVVDYVKTQGGETVAKLLGGALTRLLITAGDRPRPFPSLAESNPLG